jgi:MFS family permease
VTAADEDLHGVGVYRSKALLGAGILHPVVSLNLSRAAIVRRYYAATLAYALAGGFLAGVYPLFLRSRGLNQFEINSILALYFVVVVLCEVPTGAFADALGRRRAFMLGCALRALACAVYFTAHDYVLFLVAEAIDAVGTTFSNGAVDAWGVDALDERGYEGPKDRLFSRLAQLSSVGFMTTAVIGAYVAAVDLAWPWLLGAGGFLVSGWVGALLQERRSATPHLDVPAIRDAIALRIRLGIRGGFRLRAVRLLSLAEAITLAVWAPYWLEWPLLFQDSYGAGVWVVGWIFCLLSLARMIGAELVARLMVSASRRRPVLGGFVVGAGLLLASAGVLAARPNQALFLLFLMNVCLGAREPLALAWFNEQLGPSDRATMLSFRNAIGTAGAALGLLAGGHMVDRAGIPLHWRIAGTVSLLAVPCYLGLKARETRAALQSSDERPI